MGKDQGLGRVVVIGNSFAGLLTAAALAEHAQRVTIVDRDRIPHGPEARPGAPQARHIHVLIGAGQRSFESLLPGILAELTELGVPAVGTTGDVVTLHRGRWVRRTGPDIPYLTGTRPLLEHVVRKRVLAHPRVDTVDAAEVIGLMGNRRRVRGVVVRARGVGANPEPEQLLADLVVDASGRGSRAPEWLTTLGAGVPDEDVIDTGLAYSTRLYQGPVHPGYKGIYIVPYAGLPRAAVIMPTEEPGRFIVTLSSIAGDEPSVDPKGFESFAESLPHPIVHDWMKAATPLTAPMGYRGTANVRRHYERLGVRGLLVVGDAACAFNPVYGQGMTVAGLQAVALRDALARGVRSSGRLQKVAARSTTQPWIMAAGADKKMRGATGNAVKPAAGDRFAEWYMTKVETHSTRNLTVGVPFRRVLHLLEPISTLFAWPVLRTVLFTKPTNNPAEPPIHPEAA